MRFQCRKEWWIRAGAHLLRQYNGIPKLPPDDAGGFYPLAIACQRGSAQGNSCLQENNEPKTCRASGLISAHHQNHLGTEVFRPTPIQSVLLKSRALGASARIRLNLTTPSKPLLTTVALLLPHFRSLLPKNAWSLLSPCYLEPLQSLCFALHFGRKLYSRGEGTQLSGSGSDRANREDSCLTRL